MIMHTAMHTCSVSPIRKQHYTQRDRISLHRKKPLCVYVDPVRSNYRTHTHTHANTHITLTHAHKHTHMYTAIILCTHACIIPITHTQSMQYNACMHVYMHQNTCNPNTSTPCIKNTDRLSCNTRYQRLIQWNPSNK